MDGGFTFTGLIPGRPTDLIGFGAAYDHISNSARAFDRDGRLFTAAAIDPTVLALPGSPFAPVRDQEVMLEAIYTINVTQWLTLDLDVQHFFHPSGHVLAPSGPNLGKVVKDTTVYGLNTLLKLPPEEQATLRRAQRQMFCQALSRRSYMEVHSGDVWRRGVPWHFARQGVRGSLFPSRLT